MTTITRSPEAVFDLKQTIADRRIVGFWRLLRGLHARYGAAALGLGVAATLNSAKFLLIGYFIDQILRPYAAYPGVLVGVALTFVLLAALQGLATFTAMKLAASTAESIALRLRDYLFDHIQRLSFTYHDQAQVGDLVTRCSSDVDAIRRFFAEQAVGVGRITTQFGVNFVAMSFIDIRLALVSMIVVPVILIVSLLFFKRISDAYEEAQTQESKVSTALQENLTGVRVVKAFARQQFERDKFDDRNREHLRLGIRFMNMHATYWPVSDLITGAQLVLGFAVGALLTLNGEISLGSYIAYTGIVIYVIFPVRDLGRIIVDMSSGLVSYGRIADIIRQEEEFLGRNDAPPTNAIRGDVTFQNVTFAYKPGMSVLQNVSFEAKAGQTVALLGSTGSGKTTAMSLLPRFYDYTQGSITIDGIELSEFPRCFLRQHIGVVEQEPFLFSRSIRENITYGVGREVSDEDVIAAAKAAALHETIGTFPEGYNTLLGEKGVTLSGGQKQRVALARTLLRNPRILILDDATSSVDTETESQIRDALTELMQGRTSFIIAHRIQSVMIADLILVMDHGRIVQRGTHDELMAEGGVYRRIYEMQAQIETELEQEIADVRI